MPNVLLLLNHNEFDGKSARKQSHSIRSNGCDFVKPCAMKIQGNSLPSSIPRGPQDNWELSFLSGFLFVLLLPVNAYVTASLHRVVFLSMFYTASGILCFDLFRDAIVDDKAVLLSFQQASE